MNTCQAVATNILVTQSDGVTVTGNTVGINQVGIFIDGIQAEVDSNETFLSSIFDGIRLVGNQGRVRRNNVFNGSEAGIFVAGNNIVIDRNTITQASVGILKATGCSGNLIRRCLARPCPCRILRKQDSLG